MKKFLSLLLATMMTFSLVACGGGEAAPETDTTNDTEVAAEGDTIKIGIIAPLTGTVASYGVSARNGEMLAINQINANGGIFGKQIEVIEMDDKAEATECTNAFNKLMDEGVAAILGPVTSGATTAVAPIADESGMILIAPSATADTVTEGYSSVFRACFKDSYQGEMAAKFAAETLGVKDVAVMYASGDAYSAGLYEAFKAGCEKYGLNLVAEESSANITDTDYSAQLTNIAAKNPELIYIPYYYDVSGPFIIPQARQTGFEGYLMGADGWDGTIPTMIDDKSVYNNCFFTNHYATDDPSEVVQKFVSDYSAEYGADKLSAFAALGYDTAYMLKQAIETAGSADTADIIEAMTGMQFSGVTGSFTLDETGTPKKSVSVIEFVDGSAVFKTSVSADE